MFSHSIISDFNSLGSQELAAIERSWNLLAERFKSPILDFDWFYTCATTIHSNDILKIVVVSNDEGIVAIAPLYLNSEGGYRQLQILGTVSLYEPSGLLYADRSCLRYLLNTIQGLGYPVELRRLSDETILSSVANDASLAKGPHFILPTATSRYIETQGSYEDLEKKMSTSRRADIRRKRRRAEKLGEVSVRISSPTDEEFDAQFEAALKIEESSWKGTTGSALANNHSLREFFKVYAHAACASGSLRFFFLAIEEVPVAMHIAIEAHEALWILKLGYRHDYSSCSPGMALTNASIQYCFEQGLARYEFLGSTESWQSAWPTMERDYFSILLFPWSLHGFVGLANVAGNQLVKTLRRMFDKLTGVNSNNRNPAS